MKHSTQSVSIQSLLTNGQIMFGYLFIALLLMAGSTLSADILVVNPYPGYSHFMPFLPIFKELGRRGHNLTVISTFPQKPTPEGFTQLTVNLTIESIAEVFEKKFGIVSSLQNVNSVLGTAFELAGISLLCECMTPIMMERVKPLLPPPGTRFDLLIMEPFFCMEPLVAASSVYNAPIVATLPLPLMPSAATVTGNPHATSYVPNFRTPFTGKMTFLQRVWNTMVNVAELLMNAIFHYPYMDKMMREVWGQPDLPYIGDLLKNISLILIETHFSINYPRPYLRNVVEVGGISALMVEETLPKDLESYMDKAEHGVIYFSWGSHFEPKDAEKILQVLMNVFSKRKESVLFKWYEDIPNTPSNVRVQKWFPQRSILAHNKTVLFISHGGLNSISEAAYYGVPVLGTPLFGDQPYNIGILESLGMAVSINAEDLDDGISFQRSLEKILKDPSFRENAIKERLRVRDRPLGVVEEAVYWIEYIVKHGAEHLQPASKDLPWYSIALLDVSLFLISIAAIILYLVYSLLAFCLTLCWRKRPTHVATKKKKQ